MDDYETLRRWRKNIPNLHNGSFRRTWDKAVTKKSMRAAVNAKCQDCMNWQQSEIRHCSVITCPLWQYRPNQDKEKGREKTVRSEAGQLGTGSDSSFANRPLAGTLARRKGGCERARQ